MSQVLERPVSVGTYGSTHGITTNEGCFRDDGMECELMCSAICPLWDGAPGPRAHTPNATRVISLFTHEPLLSAVSSTSSDLSITHLKLRPFHTPARPVARHCTIAPLYTRIRGTWSVLGLHVGLKLRRCRFDSGRRPSNSGTYGRFAPLVPSCLSAFLRSTSTWPRYTPSKLASTTSQSREPTRNIFNNIFDDYLDLFS